MDRLKIEALKFLIGAIVRSEDRTRKCGISNKIPQVPETCISKLLIRNIGWYFYFLTSGAGAVLLQNGQPQSRLGGPLLRLSLSSDMITPKPVW